MEQSSEKMRVLRKSAQFYVTAEEHIKNEMKHERHLTETSRLTSSWANLRLTATDKPEYSDCGFSSTGSSESSPVGHRPNSFSGPLVISVTCSSGGDVLGANVIESKSSAAITTTLSNSPFSLSPSYHPSPVASPVSSRVQCYSSSIGLSSSFAAKKRTASVSSGRSASPLLLSSSRGRKRTYNCLQSTDIASSTEVSRESSPEPPHTIFRFGKMMRSSDGAIGNIPSMLPHFGSHSREFSLRTSSTSTPASPAPPMDSSMHMTCSDPSTTSLPFFTHSNSSSTQSYSSRLPVSPPQPSDFNSNDFKLGSPFSHPGPESESVDRKGINFTESLNESARE